MTTMVVPSRSMEQRMSALATANRIRAARAEWKRKLKAGEATMVDLMADPRCDTMRVYDVLMAYPKLGRVKANRILSKCTISPSKTLAGLTYRQRHELLLWVRG